MRSGQRLRRSIGIKFPGKKQHAQDINCILYRESVKSGP